MKILINDGLAAPGIDALKQAGFEVLEVRVAQSQLERYINENDIEILIVRSATKVPESLIDACPGLRLIARAGIGLDNIAADYARQKNIHIVRAVKASAISVAELVFAHLFTGARSLHDANRNMPLEGDTQFASLKKQYSRGLELRGKTLGIIGLGHVGREVAKIGLGLGMRILASSRTPSLDKVTLEIFPDNPIDIAIQTDTFENVLSKADFISLHVPAGESALINAEAFSLMKDGVGIINTSRGNLIDEVALIDALDEGKVSFAGLDVFQDEPTPAVQVLMHPQVSLSPHIGASTLEAGRRISEEIASQIIGIFGSQNS